MGDARKLPGILRYVVIPGVLLLILVGALNFFMYQRQLEFFRTVYNNEVAETKSLINRRMQSAFIAAESLKALFVSSQEVTRQEFDSFGSALTKNIYPGAIFMPVTVEWVDAKNDIRYVYPMSEENRKIVGLDLNKYPNRLTPITKAKETKSAVVTEPIMLAQGYPGLIIYSPIFKGENYFGEAVVVVRLSNLFAPIPGGVQLYNKDQYIQTDGFIVPLNYDAIFTDNGGRVADVQGGLVEDPASRKYLALKSGASSEDIVLADKTWHLKVVPTYMADVNKIAGIFIAVSLFALSVNIILLWMLKRRDEESQKEVARIEALILSIGDGLVACDKNGIITFANKKAEELSGYSAKESIGKSYYDLWRLVDAKGADIPIKDWLFYRALINKEVINVSTDSHLFIVKKDGTRFPLASTIAPIIADGKVDGAIVVFRDITKESEVDRMKTEFLSLVSHQLLSPSSAIKWTADLLLGGKFGKLNEKQLEYVQNIHASNESMIGLVTSLLNVSRIESGRIVVDPKPVNLHDLVGEVVKELENKIKEKEHKFSLDAEAGLPQINVDPNLIRQVYKNLLTNAIKYTPAKGSISVTITKDKDSIISKVSDSGYGIPEKDKKRVFEKFYRGENIVSAEKEGNGLGLYLVRQIIEVSGGKIWFESEINKGTTFWFSLPLSGSKPKAGEVTIS